MKYRSTLNMVFDVSAVMLGLGYIIRPFITDLETGDVFMHMFLGVIWITLGVTSWIKDGRSTDVTKDE
jgi:hypothetical protein